MYAILTENIELVKLAETQNAQIFDLGNFTPIASSMLYNTNNNSCFQESEKFREKEIFKLLINLGIPASLKGFKYIFHAIILLLDDDSYENSEITKRLYPDIAKYFNTTPASIERGARVAIEHVFEKGSNKLIHDVFGTSLDINNGKTTNSEFIIGIKNYLKIMCNL